jgi:hypothetical protein
MEFSYTEIIKEWVEAGNKEEDFREKDQGFS